MLPSDLRHSQPCVPSVASQQNEREWKQELQAPLSSAQITVVRYSGAPKRIGHYSGQRDERRLLTGVREPAKIKKATKDKARRLTW